ncbi:HAD-IA family hydrolase [Candidatus Dojkabacteria bacterium]|nr:HAD-IA family hydrolase [Candidatus Dojkabacteria bacterium]
MKIKAIIFDYDDTLVNTHHVIWDKYKLTGKKFYDIEITEESLREHWGEPFEQLQKNLFGDVDDPESIKENYFSLNEQFPKSFLPGVPETLKQLKSIGYNLSIVSAMLGESVEGDLIRMGIDTGSMFHFIQGAEHTDFHKPDPKVFLPSIEKLAELNIKPEEVLYVGDSVRDYQAASGAGFDFQGVLTGLTTAEDFKKEGVSYLKDFAELLSLDNQ